MGQGLKQTSQTGKHAGMDCNERTGPRSDRHVIEQAHTDFKQTDQSDGQASRHRLQ